MLAVPAETPVTTPPMTEAVNGALLLQVPPGVTSASVAVVPAQMITAPAGVMTAGLALIVTTSKTEQLPTAYVIVSVPAVMPVTTPPRTDALPLPALQVPPVVPSVSVTVLPMHTEDDAGDIAAGAALTVTIFRAEQPYILV